MLISSTKENEKGRSAQLWVTQATAQGVKVFQLSFAARVNYGDCPKILRMYTTVCVKFHLPKFC